MLSQKQIVSIVADLYEELEIHELGFDLFDVCKKLNIVLIPYTSYSKDEQRLLRKRSKDGFSLANPKTGKYTIWYNDGIRSEGRINCTLSHEIGHCILGHNLTRKRVSYNSKEKEASMFSRIFYTPLVVLKDHEEYVNDQDIMQRDLHISHETATELWKLLIKRGTGNNFKASPEEERLYEIFTRNQKKFNDDN